MVAVGKEVRAQSPVSFQAKVGIGLASFWGKNTDGKAKFSYKIGAGMDYTFGNYIQSYSITLVKRCKDLLLSNLFITFVL